MGYGPALHAMALAHAVGLGGLEVRIAAVAAPAPAPLPVGTVASVGGIAKSAFTAVAVSGPL